MKRKNMKNSKKWDLLFIQEENSELNSNTPAFDEHFNFVDKVLGKEEALMHLKVNKYDVIINDITQEALDGINLIKVIREKMPDQSIFALVAGKDEDKLYGIADLLGVNAFLLEPEQLDLALEAIGEMDPYAKKEKHPELR